MKKPTLLEQIRVVQQQRKILVDSYTDLIGPTKNKISDKKISREVECLDEAVKSLRALRRVKKALL